jgi:hypothetical protein
MGSGPERVMAYIDRYNDAVRSGSWDQYLDGLADSVRMEFVGEQTGPYDGRYAIGDAYKANPSNDTISVIDLSTEGSIDIVRFSWDRGGSGLMRITWTPDDRVEHVIMETT